VSGDSGSALALPAEAADDKGRAIHRGRKALATEARAARVVGNIR
jgi:hypothetical protein